MSRIIITGPSGGAPNRLEINQFVRDEKFFSLYIQALQRMENVTQTDYQSFFQVGGIHGIPYTPWDGASGNPNGAWGGYCTHASVLFPTWHRPYVMLYEQILQKHAIAVAATYTVNQAAWQQAASDLRQPYWDWAVNSVPPAEVISQARVTITNSAGARVQVDNPLLHYQFHPIPPEFTGDLRNWPATLRNPTSSGSGATSNVTQMVNVLRNAQTNITSNTYAMLTRIHTWDAFSNTRVTPGTAANSVEGVHNGIHNNVGGGGHMSRPTVAAFDPIFQLHHANVDRMLSLWAALNPGVWVSRGNAFDGTFTIPANSTVDGNTPLGPFWNTQNSFWASNATTDTSRLGYTYPEFNGLDMGNQQAVKTAIGAIVNRLYGASVFGSLSTHPALSLAALSASSAPAAPVAAAGHAGSTSVEPPNHGLFDWVARIQFKKFEIGTSFSVPIFLGKVPEDPKEWLTSSNFVGAHHAFVNDNPEECENCRNQADIVEEGFVHLDAGIVKHSGLKSLEHDVVAPYLTKELNWRVMKPNGEAVELKSLEVHIMSTPLEYPAGAMFPIDGTPLHHHHITSGRQGGSRHA